MSLTLFILHIKYHTLQSSKGNLTLSKFGNERGSKMSSKLSIVIEYTLLVRYMHR